MNIKRNILLAAAAFAVLAPVNLGFSPALAAPANSGSLIDKDFEVALRKFVSKRFFNRIDATNDQREKLSAIFSDTQESTRPDRESLRQGLIDLSSMMANDKVNDEDIAKKVHELRELRSRIMDKRLSAALAARKVLTAEQRQKIHDKITEVLTGGLKPRAIGFLLNTNRLSFLDSN